MNTKDPANHGAAATSGAADRPVTVVVADDHPVVRAGIAHLLEREADIRVVAQACTGQDALLLARQLAPDVLLLDMELPDLKGYQVVEQIRREKLPVNVLVLSAHNDPQYVQELLAYGVAGYLVKEEPPERIVEAVRGAARGEPGWISRRVTAEMTDKFRKSDRASGGLTPRETEILECLVDSKTNQEIAFKLGISVKTVEKHLVSLFAKLRVSSRVEAAVMVARERLDK